MCFLFFSVNVFICFFFPRITGKIATRSDNVVKRGPQFLIYTDVHTLHTYYCCKILKGKVVIIHQFEKKKKMLSKYTLLIKLEFKMCKMEHKRLSIVLYRKKFFPQYDFKVNGVTLVTYCNPFSSVVVRRESCVSRTFQLL